MLASTIRKVAVIGAGVMGGQIAAHIANANVPVVLLDIVPKEAQDRNVLADMALAKMKKDASAFMHPDNAKLITTGNLEDDLEKVSEADWIIEAVLEDRQIKSGIYKKIDVVRKTGSIVSSNTSTIPLCRLIDGQSESFVKDFLVTHFFNPPRQMRLMEMVVGEKTSPNAVEIIVDFCDRRLGKNVIKCAGMPGFVVQRLGLFFLQCAMNAAFDLGLSVEEADAVFGKPLGIPKTGIFGLIDLIGIDLMPIMEKNLLASLPENDPYRAMNISNSLIEKMISSGYTGRKGKGGFYRIQKTQNQTVIEVIDLKTGEYRPMREPKLKLLGEDVGENLEILCGAQDNIGKFAWIVLSETLSYAASLVPQIADGIVSIDTIVRLGYNWQFGLFELIDKLGAKWFAQKLRAEHHLVPELLRKAENASFYRAANGKLEFLTTEGKYQPIVRPEGVMLLADIKLTTKPVLENKAASVWNIGDGVLCFEFHTKMNTINTDTFKLLNDTIKLIEGSGRHRGLVIYNEADLFSVGANLGDGLLVKDEATFAALRQLIRQGQKTYHALRFARFPTVSAPSGFALGGACELTLHCSAVQAYAEVSIGLVEILVGVIPGWGGCTQMLGRAFERYISGDTLEPIRKVFEIVSQARRSTSAFEACDLLYLRKTDGITMNRDRLLFDAKQRLMQLAKDYRPPRPLRLNLPGRAGYVLLESMIEGWRSVGKALPHDITVARALASLLCGEKHNSAQPVTEAQILALEKREFMKLARMPETIARIEHMLKTGKPLRN